MNSKTIAKFRLFGKTGKIVMTVLSVIAAVLTVCCIAVTFFSASLPEDALTVTAVDSAELKFNKKSFNTLWNILGGEFAYTGKELPDFLLEDGNNDVTPPENQQLQIKLKLFGRSYDAAEIHSDGDSKILNAESSSAEYRSKDLTLIFVFASLFAASLTAALIILRNLFAVLTKSDSPFTDEVVSKMRAFGFFLLPVAVFASAAKSLSERFLSAGKSSIITVQWGVLIAFAVTMCLVAVFRYGVQLQKESDETL